MLRRDQQMRMQLHQLVDACIFAVSFWLTYKLRSNPDFADYFHLVHIPPFAEFALPPLRR